MIKPCKCQHAQQDEMHGKGNRVHNPLMKAGKETQQQYRCTVCGDKK